MHDLANRLNISIPVLILIGALIAVQIGLAIYALIDLWRRNRVAGGRKWVWAIVILIGNLAGPVLYLAVGRDVPPEVVDQPVSRSGPAHSQAERIRRNVDALYGPAE